MAVEAARGGGLAPRSSATGLLDTAELVPPTTAAKWQTWVSLDESWEEGTEEGEDEEICTVLQTAPRDDQAGLRFKDATGLISKHADSTEPIYPRVRLPSDKEAKAVIESSVPKPRAERGRPDSDHARGFEAGRMDSGPFAAATASVYNNADGRGTYSSQSSVAATGVGNETLSSNSQETDEEETASAAMPPQQPPLPSPKHRVPSSAATSAAAAAVLPPPAAMAPPPSTFSAPSTSFAASASAIWGRAPAAAGGACAHNFSLFGSGLGGGALGGGGSLARSRGPSRSRPRGTASSSCAAMTRRLRRSCAA